MTTFDLKPPYPARLSDVARTFGANAVAHDAEHSDGYALIEAQGADAALFLNGQLTTDILQLKVGHCQTSALCNLKGRVIAQFDIARVEEARFALFMRHSLVDAVSTTLTRYILRSKVTLTTWPKCARAHVHTLDKAPITGQVVCENSTIVCRPTWLSAQDSHWVMSNRAPNSEAHSDTDLSMAHLHVLSGIAPPFNGAELEHIPQMLNLDRMEGVSVTKGCYTGQEIIARVHHRGSVKRRLRRFICTDPNPLNIGDAITNAQGTQAGDVVEVAPDAAGRQGLLAVIKESDFQVANSGHPSGLHCGGQELVHWPLPYDV